MGCNIGTMTAWTFGLSCCLSRDRAVILPGISVALVCSYCPVACDSPCDFPVACEWSRPNSSYVTTENPNVMMRENHNTQSSEYIIIYENELYIVSTTPEEILHLLKDKYKITIYLQDKYPNDPGGRDTSQLSNQAISGKVICQC